MLANFKFNIHIFFEFSKYQIAEFKIFPSLHEYFFLLFLLDLLLIFFHLFEINALFSNFYRLTINRLNINENVGVRNFSNF